ncbi:hypothetical protein N1F91_08235 [Aquibium sp. ELW1220]|nr:hypothetical protein [Aquibium sp. ELW1220]MDN2579972.1 hypothetical protein [Aquibium sp. ELW1220]
MTFSAIGITFCSHSVYSGLSALSNHIGAGTGFHECRAVGGVGLDPLDVEMELRALAAAGKALDAPARIHERPARGITDPSGSSQNHDRLHGVSSPAGAYAEW